MPGGGKCTLLVGNEGQIVEKMLVNPGSAGAVDLDIDQCRRVGVAGHVRGDCYVDTGHDRGG